MAGPRCVEHPERAARDTPCRRCGVFACEACFEHPRHDLCEACSLKTGELAADMSVDPERRRRRRWMRKNPRLVGLMALGLGAALVALNLHSIVTDGRMWTVAFPMGGALLGIGLAAIATGRVLVERWSDAPISYWLLTAGLTGLGAVGGFILTFFW